MKYLFGITLLLFAVTLRAQQDPLYSQYLTTPLLINPGYTGFTNDLNGSVSYRKQWVGFNGGPVTMNASGYVSLADNRMGVGVILLKDEIGSDVTNEVQLTYGYHAALNDNLKLSFGLQGGMINYQTDYSNLTINPDDPKFAPLSEWRPTFGAGVLLSRENMLLSFAMPKMLKGSTDADSLATGLYNQNFYALGAYVFDVSYRIKLKPYVLLRGVSGAPLSFDYGVSLIGDNSYTLGMFTRNFNTMGFLGQINLGEHFRLGYVFELPFGNSVGTNFTTHEVMIGARIKALKFHDLTRIMNF